MVSKAYLDLLWDQRWYRNTDFDNLEQLYMRLKEDWVYLQNEWNNNDRSAAARTLFVMSRRCFEILHFLTGKDVYTLLDEQEKLHHDKNAGYSGLDNPDAWANFRECENFGISAANGVLTRLSDKYTRFWNVLGNRENDKVNENAVDTLKDLAAYSLILICILEE